MNRLMLILAVLPLVAALSCAGGVSKGLPAPTSTEKSYGESMEEFEILQELWERNEKQGDAADKAVREALAKLEQAKSPEEKDGAREELSGAFKRISVAVRNGFDITRKMERCGPPPGEISRREHAVTAWSETAKKAKEKLPPGTE